MSRETPIVTIEFEGQPSAFTIEELTFNPYISIEPVVTRDVSCNIWVEFVLRNDSADEIPALPPSIVLSLDRFHEPFNRISTGVPSYITGIENGGDLNFIMYSDIWYSFVKLNDEQYEFMSSGYKKAIRTLYEPNEFDSESYLTGSCAAFKRGNLVSHCSRLTDRVIKFNEVIRGQGVDSLFTAKSMQLHRNVATILTPRAETPFASVSFERPSWPVRARFGLRREPWPIDGEQRDGSYGIGYCGTTEIQRHPSMPNAVILVPKAFSPSDSKPMALPLNRGEQIRFWIHIGAPEAVAENDRKTLAYFDCIVSLKAKVEVFNSFFRVPEDYQLLGGGLTDPQRYSVPPRLFFVWQDYKPHQCYAHNRSIGRVDERIHLSTTFANRRADQNQLITVFALSAIVSLCGNMIVTVYFGDDAVRAKPVLMFLGILAGTVFTMGVFAGARVYLGARIIWSYGAAAVGIIGSAIAVGMWLGAGAQLLAVMAIVAAMPAALYATDELQRWWRQWSPGMLLQFGISRWWLRRKLIRQLRGEGL
jgi:hypothetical protein